MTGTIQYLNIPKSSQTSGLLYVHKQTVSRKIWLINHQMGCVPQFVIYDATGLVIPSHSYEIVEVNVTAAMVKFNTKQNGYCQAYRTDTYRTETHKTENGVLQSSSQGIITLAVSTQYMIDSGCTSVSVVHKFTNSINALVYDVQIENGVRGSTTAPWTATTAVAMNSNTYQLCRVDISGFNRESSSIQVTPNSNHKIKQYDMCLLLSSPPNHDQADELYHSVIDIIDVNADPNVGSVINGEYIITTKLVRPVFPPIQKR